MTDRERYSIDPADAVQFCLFWSAHVDALERHLDGMDHIDQPSKPTKRKTRRR